MADADVDPAEAFEGLLGRPLDRALVGHIATGADGGDAGLGQPGQRPFRLGLVTCPHGHRGAGPTQRRGDAETDPPLPPVTTATRPLRSKGAVTGRP